MAEGESEEEEVAVEPDDSFATLEGLIQQVRELEWVTLVRLLTAVALEVRVRVLQQESAAARAAEDLAAAPWRSEAVVEVPTKGRSKGKGTRNSSSGSHRPSSRPYCDFPERACRPT